MRPLLKAIGLVVALGAVALGIGILGRDRTAGAQVQAGNVFQFKVTFNDAGTTNFDAGGTIRSDAFLTTTLGSASVCCTLTPTDPLRSTLGGDMVLEGSNDGTIWSTQATNYDAGITAAGGAIGLCVNSIPSPFVFERVAFDSIVTDGGFGVISGCSGADKL